MLSGLRQTTRRSPGKSGHPQSEHTARFDRIDRQFDRIEKMLADILAKLP